MLQIDAVWYTTVTKWVFRHFVNKTMLWFSKYLCNFFRITLLKDGGLRITNVTKVDAGSYTCVATNQFGTASGMTNLVVTGRWAGKRGSGWQWTANCNRSLQLDEFWIRALNKHQMCWKAKVWQNTYWRMYKNKRIDLWLVERKETEGFSPFWHRDFVVLVAQMRTFWTLSSMLSLSYLNSKQCTFVALLFI